jgi:FixJ family two-component response regulator
MISEGGQVTIHILEDDPGVSDSLRLLVEGMGHSAIAYPSAEQFFALARPHPSDTVVVDLMLPGIGGAHVIRWLLDLREPPRVVAISGQPQPAIESQVRGLGDLEVLRKPLTSQTIAALV